MDAISRIHQFQKFGWVLGLERMNELLGRLGDPHKNLKVIHVAGTNGKGSVCRYIYEVLQAAGYRCGLFTSPFLETFHERIEFDGRYITDEALQRCSDQVLEKAEEMTAQGLESPTEFEVVTAIAFVYFRQMKADIAILEVGLGGRGDSTNVVANPLVSIITSISLDHTDRLGNTIAEIAEEKAGIIKAGCPVVTSVDRPEAMAVFEEKCRALQAPLYDCLRAPCRILEEKLEGTRFLTEYLGEEFNIEISMTGRHQLQNARAALAAIALLNRQGKIKTSQDAVIEGMKKAKQKGRFEIIGRNPYIIIDGAHNPDGSKALESVTGKFFPGKRILMVCGILADKEVDQVLSHFLNITSTFVATEPDNPRKMTAQDLAEKITARGGSAVCRANPADAVTYALSQKEKFDLILFAGSLYLIGTIRGILNEQRN